MGGGGGFSGPRPGGFSGPRPAEGSGGAARNRNFGPDAPPKHKRKSAKERDKPRGPIKERPVGRLYDADEDWRATDTDDLGIDNVATHTDHDETEDE
jgi:hypothetical protein